MSLYLQVTDGRAELASFVILSDVAGTIMCFSQDEFDRNKTDLDAQQIQYTTEAVTWTDEQRNVVIGKDYYSADEARQDINGTRQPSELEKVKTDLTAAQEAINFLLGV